MANAEKLVRMCRVSKDGTKRLVEIRPGVWRYIPIKARKR
jgi:hypothetical protein